MRDDYDSTAALVDGRQSSVPTPVSQRKEIEDTCEPLVPQVGGEGATFSAPDPKELSPVSLRWSSLNSVFMLSPARLSPDAYMDGSITIPDGSKASDLATIHMALSPAASPVPKDVNIHSLSEDEGQN